jgi:hypothetical protein
MTRRAGSRTPCPCPARTALAPAPAPERRSDDAPLVHRDWLSNAGAFSPGYHARACHVRRACRVYLGVVAGRHAPAYVLRLPLPTRYHPAWRVDVSALRAQLSRCRGTPGRAGHRGHLREHPALGPHLRPDDRTKAAGETAEAARAMAPGRDGDTVGELVRSRTHLRLAPLSGAAESRPTSRVGSTDHPLLPSQGNSPTVSDVRPEPPFLISSSILGLLIPTQRDRLQRLMRNRRGVLIWLNKQTRREPVWVISRPQQTVPSS